MLILENGTPVVASAPVLRSQLTARAGRERAAYDTGSVVDENRALQARFRHVFGCPNSLRAERYFDAQLARLARQRDLLDYGCYDGGMLPRYLAMGPRRVTGIDISETGIALARARFGLHGQFHVGDAHAMPFADASFDLVVGRAILHHLDWQVALREVRRVLRPGGQALFVEPLGDNPAARLLRTLTPRARTRDERPLTRDQLHFADALFPSNSHLFFNLLSVPAAMLTSLTTLTATNPLLHLADAADRCLSRTPLRYWMRAVVLIWHR